MKEALLSSTSFTIFYLRALKIRGQLFVWYIHNDKNSSTGRERERERKGRTGEQCQSSNFKLVDLECENMDISSETNKYQS